MKSTEQRDLYAAALEAYRIEVPIDQWSRYGQTLSKSGLAKEIQKRGHPRFERKRLDSAACKPIVEEMEVALSQWVNENEKKDKEISQENSSVSSYANSDVKRLHREIERLERELKNTQRRESSYRHRCALLEAQLEAVKQQQGKFEQHCTKSLRTLHV